MREYFALKDGLDSAAITRSLTQNSSPPGESQPQPRLSHPIVRLIEEHAMQDQKLDLLSRRLAVLACMIDQAYQGLIGRMAEVPAQLRARRAAVAAESSQRWRAAVSKLLRHRGHDLLDDFSNGEE
jgi:hypothetical protein